MKKTAFAGLFALTSAIALTACGDSGADTDGDGKVSADEVRAEVESAGEQVKPEPGKYKTTMTFVSADIPGAPPEMVEAMGSAPDRSFEFCMTPEMAAKGYEESLTQGQNDDCTIETFDVDGSDVDMAMNCKAGENATMKVTMQGKVTPTRTTFNVQSNGDIPQLGKAKLEVTMVQERVGECDS